MKPESSILPKDPDQSFILHYEDVSFARWHHHPEFELVLILNGRGKRMVGDHIDRFDTNDLVLLGSYLPHEYLCDNEFTDEKGFFRGRAIVIQFVTDFLGSDFFHLPENRNLLRLIRESYRGIKFFGRSREALISLMKDSHSLDGTDRLYTLMSIFRILNHTTEYTLLSSPGFMEPFHNKSNEPVQKAKEYILQHFQDEISIKDMLTITNMSASRFSNAFRNSCRMTFKEYLLSVRIGYACKLLTDDTLDINQVAYGCGFENLSNFNRQFRKIKKLTPTMFRKYANGTYPEPPGSDNFSSNDPPRV